MIQKILLGCGIVMTVGLFFIFRSLLRQVREENRVEAAKERPEDSASR